MKRTLSLLILFCSSFSLFAQKVDLDKFYFKLKYRDLPETPLKKDYRTYNVLIKTSGAVRSYYSDGELEDAVFIEGWRRLTSGSGHLHVDVSLGDLDITSSDISVREETGKNKDGKEIVTRYY